MNILAKAAKALTAMRHPARPLFYNGLLQRTRFDYRREVGDCLGTSVVTAPVDWMSSAEKPTTCAPTGWIPLIRVPVTTTLSTESPVSCANAGDMVSSAITPSDAPRIKLLRASRLRLIFIWSFPLLRQRHLTAAVKFSIDCTVVADAPPGIPKELHPLPQMIYVRIMRNGRKMAREPINS